MSFRRGDLQALRALCDRLDSEARELENLILRESELERELNRVRLARNAAQTAVLQAQELLKGFDVQEDPVVVVEPPKAPVVAEAPGLKPRVTLERPRITPDGQSICVECQHPFTPRPFTTGRRQVCCTAECQKSRTRRKHLTHRAEL